MFWTIVIGGFVLLLITWLKSSPFKWSGKGIHWMIPWPIFGNSTTMFTKTYYDYWLSFYRHGEGQKMVGFHYLQDPAILVRDPQLIKQVMISDSDSFSLRGFFVGEHDFIRSALFFVGGEEWKNTRTKMTPYFSPSRIKGMWSLIEYSVDEYVSHIEAKSKKGPVDVDDMSIRLTTDTVISSAFGLQPDSFVSSQPFFYNLQKELFKLPFALRNFCATMSQSLYNSLGLATFHPSTSQKLTGFVNQVLESRIKGVGVRPDFIQGMIELYNKENQKENDMNEAKLYDDGTRVTKFDKERVVAQCVNIFGAGTDTTGHTLGFILYELAMNQDIQDRLRKEILDKEKECNGPLGYEELKEMVYLDMIIDETTRKYPSVPALSRRCLKPTRLGNVNVAEGTWIWTSIVGLHTDPKYYPEPDKFDPERFAPGKQMIPGSYLPFGLGARICIGMNFAKMELKLAVCRLLKNLKLTPCQETPSAITSFGYGIVLYPVNGIKLNAKPYS